MVLCLLLLLVLVLALVVAAVTVALVAAFASDTVFVCVIIERDGFAFGATKELSGVGFLVRSFWLASSG